MIALSINRQTYTIDDKSVTQYVCTGDVNNDNQMDIIVADVGLDSVDCFSWIWQW